MATLYSVLTYLTPLALDDFRYMADWRDDTARSLAFSFDGWREFYVYIRGYDNGRIANALDPVMTLFFPWKQIFPVVNGIMLAFSAAMVQRLACGRPRVLPLLMVWALMIVCLPWRDTLFVTAYSLNYVWSGFFTLVFLILLKRDSRRLLPLTLLAAVVAGGFHEAFAAATLCGLALLAFRRRFRLSPRFYIAVGVYLAATLLFMLSPGLIHRFMTSSGSSLWRPLLRDMLSLFILAVTLLSMACSRRGRSAIRRSLASRAGTVALGITLSGYAIAIAVGRVPRSYYWPQLAAVALTVMLLHELAFTPPEASDAVSRSARGRLFSSLRVAAALFLFILCTAQTCAVIRWQYRYAVQEAHIMTRLAQSQSGTVFYDISQPLHAPRYTLDIPVGWLWRSPFQYGQLWHWEMTPVLGVVPTRLEYAAPGPDFPDVEPIKDSDRNQKRLLPEYRDSYLYIPFITLSQDTLVYKTRGI